MALSYQVYFLHVFKSRLNDPFPFFVDESPSPGGLHGCKTIFKIPGIIKLRLDHPFPVLVIITVQAYLFAPGQALGKLTPFIGVNQSNYFARL